MFKYIFLIRVNLEWKVKEVQKVLQGQLDLLELPDPKDLQEKLDHLAQKAKEEHLVFLVELETKDLQVHQADKEAPDLQVYQ